jgi:hypothetical protein
MGITLCFICVFVIGLLVNFLVAPSGTLTWWVVSLVVDALCVYILYRLDDKSDPEM